MTKTLKRLRTCSALNDDETYWLLWSFFSHLFGWFYRGEDRAKGAVRSKQLFLIFVYKHECYGSTLIRYHITLLHLASHFRLKDENCLFHWATANVPLLKSGGHRWTCYKRMSVFCCFVKQTKTKHWRDFVIYPVFPEYDYCGNKVLKL